MRICRYEHQGVVRYGEVMPDGSVVPLEGDLFGELKPAGETLLRDQFRMLVPVLPSKIVAVGRNYKAHAKELGNEVPAEPLLFLKATSALIPSGATIRVPRQSERVEHEAELAVVIGRTAQNLSVAQARDVVLGYTCFNDVTARDLQKKEVQFTRAKGFDTFAPMGPWIETAFDPAQVAIRCWVNGETRQDGNTRDMVFDVWTLISYISQCMTLFPGDVIATGTPSGVGPLKPGDRVEVEIEGLGMLENPIDRQLDAGA
jgi:2-keto-4-pentenoate hydratase/2-oxohepta-3-ene-1,7-dioic acid hydratase in catechol pathway